MATAKLAHKRVAADPCKCCKFVQCRCVLDIVGKAFYHEGQVCFVGSVCLRRPGQFARSAYGQQQHLFQPRLGLEP